MLIDIDAYNAETKEWNIHATLEAETACSVYPVKMSIKSLQEYLSNKDNAYYSEATYEKYVEDTEYGDEFKMTIVKPLRFTQHEVSNEV